MADINNMIEKISILDSHDFCDDVIFYIIESINSTLPHDRFTRSLIDSELALCEDVIPDLIVHVTDDENTAYLISQFFTSVKFTFSPSEYNQEYMTQNIFYRCKTDQPIPLENMIRRYMGNPQYQAFFGNTNKNIYSGDVYAKGLSYVKDRYGKSIYLKVLLKLLFGIAIAPLVFSVISMSYEYKIHESPKNFQLFDNWMCENRHEITLLVTTLWHNIMNFRHASHIQFLDETLDVFYYHADIYIAMDTDVPRLHINNLSITVKGSDEVE